MSNKPRSQEDWKRVYQAHLSKARISVLDQILKDSPADLSDLKSSSRVIISNTDLASALIRWYKSAPTPSQLPPDIVITRELTETTELPEDLGGVVPVRLLEELIAREGRFS